jgi:putative ABC transport system permease protein
MLANYFKIALRNLFRQKVYSFINISGLAVGMACFILISLWVQDELSYDQFHQNKDRLCKVITKVSRDKINTYSSWRLGPALKEKYPEIVDFCRIRFREGSPVKYGEKTFIEENFYLADPSLFSMFTFPFIKGDPGSALDKLNSIVLTEETARRYFGDDEPIGKILQVARYQSDFVVSGVIKNIPRNSHINFDLVARIELMGKQRLESWEFTGFSYVLLGKNTDRVFVTQKIANFYRDVVNPESHYTPVLQPLTQIRLYEWGKPGIIKQVYIFSIIAVFILIIACINFMNLSTARSSKRAKEVGLRKVNGSTRIQLIRQFLGESVLLSFLALAFALALVELVLPAFNRFTGKELSTIGSISGIMIILIVGLVFLTGFLSGSYPALLLSSLQPALILKGKFSGSPRGLFFRKLLVIFQFSVSIALIFCTTVVYNQLQYVQEKDLGYDKELMVTISLPADPSLQNQFDRYKNELLNLSGVLNVTAAASLPMQVGEWIEIDWEGNTGDDFLPVNYTMVDYNFFDTFNMELVEGRAFSKEFPPDEIEAVIINESALSAMEVDSPVGTRVYFAHPAFEESFRQVKIIGVVKDFHFRPLHETIRPFIFRIYRPWLAYIFIKIRPENVEKTLRNIEAISSRIAPHYPFRYDFLDETYNRLYNFETKTGQLFRVFASVTIIIACLGLFGLASYTSEQKTKEIGIRKVLGANMAGIFFMLSREFLKWVLLANLIAWPIAFFIMAGWLQNFAYRTEIGFEIFLFSGMVALLIAIATVSYHAIKAAFANPVAALRYE